MINGNKHTDDDKEKRIEILSKISGCIFIGCHRNAPTDFHAKKNLNYATSRQFQFVSRILMDSSTSIHLYSMCLAGQLRTVTSARIWINFLNRLKVYKILVDIFLYIFSYFSLQSVKIAMSRFGRSCDRLQIKIL